MVADPEGEIVESRTIVGYGEFEDRAEGTGGRREVDLEALGKLGAIAVLGIAGPQLRSRDSAPLISALGCDGSIATSRCRPRQILSECLGIEASRKTQLAGQ